MVKASSLDMSLADIIKTKKTTKKTTIKKASAGGVKKRGSFKTAGTPRRQSGAGGIKKSTPRRSSSGGAPATVATGNQNDKRTVRINLSNLAPTVNSNDLHELFGSFKLRSVNVNFSEQGTPLGTGDITLSKFNADKLVRQFAGVALDGKVMNFIVIETSNIAARTHMTGGGTPKRKVGAKGARKVPVGTSPKAAAKAATLKKKKLGAKKTKREAKPQKTAAELDAELDAYMSKSS